jgi:hypothetical protein
MQNGSRGRPSGFGTSPDLLPYLPLNTAPAGVRLTDPEPDSQEQHYVTTARDQLAPEN